MRRWTSFGCAALAIVPLLAPAAGAAEPEKEPEGVVWKDLVAGQSKFQLYGFFRLDIVFDDSKPDNAQSPLFIPSEDPTVRPEGQENFTIHPRLTRFGLNVKGPKVDALGDATLGGKLETDFQNGGRESRPIIRIRHAYLKLSWERVSLLAGQTWDVISPLYPVVNADTLMWNAGNIGDRRPQLRLAFEPKIGGGILSATGALGLTGAIDEKNLDGDGTRDGEASGRPNLEARLGWSRPFGEGKSRLSVGLGALRAWEETATPVAGHDEFTSRSVGLDVQATVHDRVTIQGEAWTGKNLSDFRGGIGQGVNAGTGAEIRSKGGWAEVGVKTCKLHSIHGGYSLDDPDDLDIPAGGRTKNRAGWIVNRFETGGPFLIGMDYLHWTTEFQGLSEGTDNRVNVYLQYGY